MKEKSSIIRFLPLEDDCFSLEVVVGSRFWFMLTFLAVLDDIWFEAFLGAGISLCEIVLVNTDSESDECEVDVKEQEDEEGVLVEKERGLRGGRTRGLLLSIAFILLLGNSCLSDGVVNPVTKDTLATVDFCWSGKWGSLLSLDVGEEFFRCETCSSIDLESDGVTLWSNSVFVSPEYVELIPRLHLFDEIVFLTSRVRGWLFSLSKSWWSWGIWGILPRREGKNERNVIWENNRSHHLRLIRAS